MPRGYRVPHHSELPSEPTSPKEMQEMINKGERVRSLALKLLKKYK